MDVTHAEERCTKEAYMVRSASPAHDSDSYSRIFEELKSPNNSLTPWVQVFPQYSDQMLSACCQTDPHIATRRD